jgi:hypothetical protein
MQLPSQQGWDKRGMGNGERGKIMEMSVGLFPFPPYPLPISSWLPLNGAFLRRVNLGLFRDWESFTEQEPLNVVEEKILRVGTSEIQPIVIDDLGLLLKPTGPARLANLGGDSLSEFIRKRRKTNCRSLFATMFAFNIFGHY